MSGRSGQWSVRTGRQNKKRKGPLRRAGLELLEDRRLLATITVGASLDNTLYESSIGNLSNGVGSYFFAGKTNRGQIRRGLVAFDLADQIPAGATIVDASLTLRLSKTPSPATTQAFSLHRVETAWGEGGSNASGEEGTGTTAQAGDATWVYSVYQTERWTDQGGDFFRTASATTNVTGVGFYSWSSAQLIADIQDWVDSPGDNFGWALLGPEVNSRTAKRFDSRQNASTANRPKLEVTYELPQSTPPTVSVEQAASQSDPTSDPLINFTVVFSEAVIGFDNSDVTLGGTAMPTTAVVTGSGTTYNVAVSGMTQDGTVIASVGAGVAMNAAGDLNLASTSTDNQVAYDNNPPTVTVEQADGQNDPTNESPINFSVVFSEVVTSFDNADVTLGGTAMPTTAVVTGSGTTYNVAVSGMTQDGTVIATVGAGVAIDTAGNLNLASTSADNQVAYDSNPPTVIVEQAGGQNDPTRDSPINFTVVFSEAVTGFDDTDVTLTGTAMPTTAVVTGGGTTYNVAVSGMSQDGTVIASVGAGAAMDTAGNLNLASTSTDNQVTWGIAAPTVASVELNAGLTDPPVADQPTSWQQQRSDIRSIVVTFSDQMQPITAADLKLTNLGVNSPMDPDAEIALDNSQLTQDGPVLTIGFEPFQLPDGVYSLDILPSVSSSNGVGLDGDGDGTPGDPYPFVGDTTNRFHKLMANFNGDTGVTIFDFPTFQFWFNRQQPPSYVDLSPDGLVTIFDFPAFSDNFLAAVILPPGNGLQSDSVMLAAPSVDPATEAAVPDVSRQLPAGGTKVPVDASVRRRADEAYWRQFPAPQADVEDVGDIEDVIDQLALEIEPIWRVMRS